MSRGITRLKDALKQMEEATAPFEIKYVACNKKKGNNGRIMLLKKCCKAGFNLTSLKVHLLN